YMFKHLVAIDPWSRAAMNGFRCASYPTPPPRPTLATIEPRLELELPAPVSDETFSLLQSLYSYDRDSLAPRGEREDTLTTYRRQTVSIRTAYDDERMDVHLLIPLEAEPPYQSVIWFPGGDVFLHHSSERFSSGYLFDFLPSAGRVVIHPVYLGM